ncbi:MAG: hypothetical protein AB1349_11280 [Elusimicrobiota bacterium]
MREIILELFCICFITNTIFSAQKPTVLFLTDAEPGAKLYSMGEVFSSVSPADAFNNPWFLGWTVDSGISLSQWSGVIENSKYNFGGVILPYTKLGTLSISYLEYNTGTETVEELDGTTRKITLEKDTLISIGYGLPFSQSIFVGGNAKYLTSTLADEYKATSILNDVGIVYRSLKDKHTIDLLYMLTASMP